jgi:hypothetical protein
LHGGLACVECFFCKIILYLVIFLYICKKTIGSYEERYYSDSDYNMRFAAPKDGRSAVALCPCGSGYGGGQLKMIY